MKATILDLRYRTKDVLKAIERGETVAVLYRGKEKALLMPSAPNQPGTALRKSEAFGLWKDRKDLRNVAAFVRSMREGRFPDF
jgi:antitoxin (DNA-binding transcriptional repressor) of toxin-antitoxin stability system